MADLQYNFLNNSFTTYQDVENPKVELNIPLMDSPLDISEWASRISSNGTPIVKDNIQSPKMIIDNNPEQEYVQSTSYQQPTYSTNDSNLKGRPKQAVEFFKSKFINELNLDEQTASRSAKAIVGNLMLESGDSTLTKTDNIGDKDKGPNGSSYGMGQWRLDRRTALKNFATKLGKPMSDFNTQLEFIWNEMNGSQKGYKVLEKLINSSTIEEATTSFMNTFERPNSNPKINGINTRIKYAKSLG